MTLYSMHVNANNFCLHKKKILVRVTEWESDEKEKKMKYLHYHGRDTCLNFRSH